MKDDKLALILGQALYDSDDVTLPGIEEVIGELALHIRSVSGDSAGEIFLARVRSSSLRLLEQGADRKPVTFPDETFHSDETDIEDTLSRVRSAMHGSTSPSL